MLVPTAAPATALTIANAASHTSDLVVRPRQRLKSIAMLHQASVYHKSMLDAEWKKKMRATDVWQQLRDQRLPRQLDAGEWDAAVTELEAATRGLVSTEAEAEAARAALREALRRAKAAEAVAAAQRQAVLPAEQQEAEVVRLVHTAASSLTSLMVARAARKEAAELREQTEQLQNERLQMQQQMEQLQRASLARKFSPRTDSKSSAAQEHVVEQHHAQGTAIEPCSLSDAFAAVLLDEQHVPAVHMPVASWPCSGGEGTQLQRPLRWRRAAAVSARQTPPPPRAHAIREARGGLLNQKPPRKLPRTTSWCAHRQRCLVSRRHASRPTGEARRCGAPPFDVTRIFSRARYTQRVHGHNNL